MAADSQEQFLTLASDVYRFNSCPVRPFEIVVDRGLNEMGNELDVICEDIQFIFPQNTLRFTQNPSLLRCAIFNHGVSEAGLLGGQDEEVDDLPHLFFDPMG